MPSSDQRRVVLITGATSGIGLELAMRLKARGDRLLLVGRNALVESQTSLCEEADYCQCDLRDPCAAERTAAFVAARAPAGLDCLVHNAAAGWVGDFCDQPESSIADLLAVDLFYPIRLSRLLANGLLSRAGHLLLVSSVVAWLPSERFVVYAAAKAGLEAFGRALAIEWRGRAFVSIARLGAVRTGLHAKSGLKVELNRSMRWPSANQAAEFIEQVLSKPADATMGTGNRLMAFLGRRFPGQLSWRFGRRRQPRKVTGRFLVTGAAAGIGRELTLGLCNRGVHVVGLDVDRRRLDSLAAELGARGQAFEPLPADLNDRSGFDGLKTVIRRFGPFDGAIHNAGISAVGQFEAIELSAMDRVCRINLLAPMLLTRAMLDDNVMAPQGTVVFISSLSHFVGYPGAAAYAASKSALAAFAKGLGCAKECKTNVLAVFPGPTRTEHARRYAPVGANESRRMPAAKVARLIIRALERGDSELVCGWGNRVAGGLGRWCPGLVDRAMAKAVFEPLLNSRRG